MSGFGFGESKIMTIEEVVEDLKNALNDYAEATQSGDLDNVKMKRLREVIQNKIKSYQPENTQEGIFDDIISLLPEESMEQFVAVQENILNEDDNNIVPINTKDKNFIDKLAKNFLLGKAGLNLMYKNAQNNLDTMTGSFIDKVANVMSRMPPLPEINDDTLRELVDKSKQNISAATSGIAECKSKMIDKNVKSFVSFINVIKNTVERLWNFTPDDYEHQIWGDRSLYVNEDGELVDPVEQIRLNMIIEEYKKSCGKQLSTPVYNVEQLQKQIRKKSPLEKIGKTKSAGPRLLSSLGKRPKYLDSQDIEDTEDENSQDTLILTQESLPSKYIKPEKGGKTKKNKRKSKTKKVKRKSGRKTYKNKRNRRSKRKTRVKK